MAARNWLVKGLRSSRVNGVGLAVECSVVGETDLMQKALEKSSDQMGGLIVELEALAVERVREILKEKGVE
jgi:hypothetical protein